MIVLNIKVMMNDGENGYLRVKKPSFEIAFFLIIFVEIRKL